MAVVEIPCECGRQARATDPVPGSVIRCFYCGRQHEFEPPDLAPQGDSTRADRLSCPSCAGGMSLATSDHDSRDKIARCDYCGTVVDLPEARGRTSERIVERPGERIVERVTEWEGAIPTDDLPGGAPEPTFFEVDGKRFDSAAEFTKYVLANYPPEVAEALLRSLDRSDFQKSSDVTHVESFSGDIAAEHWDSRDWEPEGFGSSLKKLFRRDKK